jgi:PAS domain S-box-containing protein
MNRSTENLSATGIDPSPPDSQDRAPHGLVFEGGGEMGALMRAFDWSQTAVGPVDAWPQSLRTAVRIILTSRYAMFVWWGRELVNLYNDPYRAFLGSKHPAALGKSARDVWAEIWDSIGPRTDAVLLRGESTFDEAFLLLMERHGYLEETYFTFAYSPLPDDHGHTAGLFCAVTEETLRVIGERRLRLLREIAAAMAGSRTRLEVCQAAALSLAGARRDLPFSLIYLLDEDGSTLRRVAEDGILPSHPAAPERLQIDGSSDALWPVREVLETGDSVLLDNLSARFSGLPAGDWDRPPDFAVLQPIAYQGQRRPAGVLIAGLNPYRRFGVEFSGFVSLLVNQIAGAIASAIAYESERRRAEELAQLDHARTLFFSNISHEFRTPLTLMLGPLEELVPEARERLSPAGQEQLTHARRNALRLLKLVNTLLDFSRIEAGRVQAVFEPVDLCSLTSEIAGVFRSAIEKAGLRFIVHCARLDELVYIDREMWEKIVLNLLSNAFKFTFEGEVELTLQPAGRSVQLAVRDTGVGIAGDECPRVFERFHRIENTRARTYEGTGIGLALVQELAKLHSGTVSVESAPGRGSTFTVTIPLGTAHLPADRPQASRPPASTALGAEAWVDEAQRWLPQEPNSVAELPLLHNLPSVVSASEESVSAGRKCIVVADDNADMQDYLTHLLRDQYEVHAVSDGLEAVEITRRLRPALVLADVMMPHLDGFGVLNAIRNEPALSSTPVILLSARAGEESRVEGLQAGADDYLVKPFTARELKARIATHVKMAELRRQTERERRLYDTILSNTPDLAYVFDLNHRFIYANKALLAMWGRTWEESIGRNCLEVGYEPWHAAMHDHEIEQVIATKKPVRGEVPFTGTNGRRVYDYIFVPVLGPEGDVEAVAGTTRDITERANAEDALRSSEERLRAFVRATSDVVYRMSPDWSEVRQLAGKDFIADTPEADPDWLSKYIHPDDQPRVTTAIADAIRSKGIFELEHRVLRLDGTLGWTASRAVPLLSPDGEILEWFGTAADVSERKKSEEALRRTEKLAAAGRLAATVAHEINNPLAAVTNLLFLARNSSDPALIQSWLTAADEELGRISHLARQTLAFYRQTEGVRNLRIGAMLTSLLPVFASATYKRKIVIDPEIKDDPEILAAAGEIRQLIANLIGNAIDAVGKGGRIRIRISATTALHDGSRGVRLTVADNGCGISPAIRAQLFDPFVTSKQDVGTGLGLWVCRNIIEKHHGTIRAKSSAVPARSWTAFSVWLPALGRASEPAAVTPDASPTLREIRPPEPPALRNSA